VPTTKKPEYLLKRQFRFGIGEWYGRAFTSLNPEERKELADLQFYKGRKTALPCPFRSTAAQQVECKKVGGVCSLRLYERSSSTGEVKGAGGEAGELRAICPLRFEQAGLIYRWVGERVLECVEPLVLREIKFLESPPSEDDETPSDVGRIDKVLVVPDTKPLSWCALEVQAVYFQGRAMRFDFDVIRNHKGSTLPFPAVHRRPDDRSSGPKRLMPQLQIKVPSLRRWGKKMAVVVDRGFFNAMGRMRSVPHISNCDVAWFVVKFERSGDAYRLALDDVQYTTLEDSVEGLTAGVAVSLEVFEQRILSKLRRFPRPPKITPD
jgi:hypothetical protein